MSLLDGRRRRERGDGVRGSQEVAEDRRSVQLTLVHRPEHTGEDFLRVGASSGAITATNFARDDGRPQRVFGAPIAATALRPGRRDGRRGVPRENGAACRCAARQA